MTIRKAKKRPTPKTRNAVVVVARARHAGFMKDRRKRREQARLSRELRDFQV